MSTVISLPADVIIEGVIVEGADESTPMKTVKGYEIQNA